MAKISLLDHQTIDKIAAGEVVERPRSVVKELVENAIDSGATAVTEENKDVGTLLIRVTYNGCGIEKEEIRNAFLRHATSKIHSADDLSALVSLGFRGEALASIAAVSMVEAVSKTQEALTGVRYIIEGGIEKSVEEVGAPTGTTVLVRNLFYNTLPRQKFLKSPQTEGMYVSDLMEQLAMSNPHVAFHFIMNGKPRFHTAGNGRLKDVIYQIYGREVASELEEINVRGEMSITGYLGRPVLNRSNRNYEFFYMNDRLIKSSLLANAVEAGYKEYLMQHSFPFCVLHFHVDANVLDVNVHPSKMEVRIAGEKEFAAWVEESVRNCLRSREMIPKMALTEEEKQETAQEIAPEPFESNRIAPEEQAWANSTADSLLNFSQSETHAINTANIQMSGQAEEETEQPAAAIRDLAYAAGTAIHPTYVATGQTTLWEDERILSENNRPKFQLIGQVFDTYWLIAFEDQLLIMDQHAAHEKVRYERLVKNFRENTIVSQYLDPPLVLTLNSREQACLESHLDDFSALGFIVEPFGGNDYALRGVPMDVYGFTEGDFFHAILEELMAEAPHGTPESVRMKLASMACKAAVKGNMRISFAEAEALIDELLTLENPYNCPHGRPTMIVMSKQELEKKFRRIV